MDSRGKYLIDEYKEIGEYVRAYDSLIWVIGSIILPAVLASIVLFFSAERFELKAILVGGSICIMATWVLISLKYGFYQNSRLERARIIEKELGMDQHQKITRELEELRKAKFLTLLRQGVFKNVDDMVAILPIRYIRFLLGVLVIFVWTLIIIIDILN